jgi:hypothetical protein
MPRLSETIEKLETMIEDEVRFRTYIDEVDQIQKCGMTFERWKELSAQSSSQDPTTGLVYIPVSG